MMKNYSYGYETVIVKLREELSQQRQLLRKYRCKIRSQENTILSLRKRVKATKQEKTGNELTVSSVNSHNTAQNRMQFLLISIKFFESFNHTTVL
jgi:hypothetical protein